MSTHNKKTKNSHKENEDALEKGVGKVEIFERTQNIFSPIKNWWGGKKFDEIQESSDLRKAALLDSYEFLKNNYPSEKKNEMLEQQLWRLATLDAFVEKAQFHLSERAKRYTYNAYFAFSLAFAVGAIFIVIARNQLIPDYVNQLNHMTTTAAIITSLERLVIGGLMIGGVSALIGLGRSYLHESKELYSKRHTLRQGRMIAHFFMSDVKPETMIQFFEWNLETDSAFIKIKAEKPIKGTVGQAQSVISTAFSGGAEVVKAAKPSEK